jgi:multiple sugar transport system ATP-binding protein
VSFLSLERVEKTYADGTRAVRGVDLAIAEGEFIVLLGPSGCGKTTTLRMIAGLESTSSGTIRLAGRDVTGLRPSERDIGMVFQFYALYPHLRVRENIAFPLECVGLAREEIRSRVETVAAQMKLSSLLDRFPRQLSGGDQQKVSLARAIVRKPAVYLMDEPLGTLDADQRLALREFIRSRQLELKVTTIYVTHDQEEAMSLADRIVVMNQGLVRQVGTPAEIYDQPRDEFVASFVGSPGMNFFAGRLLSQGERSIFVAAEGGATLELPQATHAGPVTLGIRGEYVHVDGGGPISGCVIADEYVGGSRNVHVDSELGRLVFRGEPSVKYQRGAEIRLRFEPERIAVFERAPEVSP